MADTVSSPVVTAALCVTVPAGGHGIAPGGLSCTRS